MLTRIVVPAVMLAFAATQAAAAAPGQKLNETEIRAALVGHEVTGIPPKGKKWTALYADDGTVKYGDGKTGTWAIKGGQFCDFPKGDKEYCRTVVQLNDKKVQMVKPDGSKGSVVSW